MVTFVPSFLTCNNSNLGTVADVAGKMNIIFLPSFSNLSFIYSAHINHIRNIAGIESIGIGGDYDGIVEYVLYCFDLIY
jgi:microsomal dipeptidase-like Zn-dependent dipeptidase